MTNKREGFVLIESIISLSIISLAIYIISISFQSSYSIVESNKVSFEMLDIAKSTIDYARYYIKDSSPNDTKNNIYKNIYKDYNIITTIEKDKEYNKCYKVNVNISNENKEITLDEYVFKQ